MSDEVRITYQVDDEVHFKLDVIRRYLEDKWGRRVTRNELLDYLTDYFGPPETHEEEPDDHRFTRGIPAVVGEPRPA